MELVFISFLLYKEGGVIMIFNLPAILGLLPIVIYAIYGFKGKHPLLATSVGVIVAAILAGKNPIEIGEAIYVGAGSFLGVIGLIVMFGSGLSEMLQDTGAAPYLVKKLMSKFSLTVSGVLLGSMFSIFLLTLATGSMISATVMVATVAVTLAASYDVSPSALSIAFHCSGVAGLLLGPFTAPTMQLMNVGNITYADYALKVGLPFSIIIFLIGIFMSKWAQKKYGPEGEKVMYPPEESAKNQNDDERPNAKRAANAFVITILALIVFGVIKEGGMNYALFMLPVASIIVGFAAKYDANKIMEILIEGCSKMAWFYLMFVLFDPFISFITDTGAFYAVGELFKPLVEAGGTMALIMVGTLFGIFGISGAAVAQVDIMNGMFSEIAVSLGVPLPLFLTMLLIGSQITSFAYPGADMVTEMGLARSEHLKSLIINGWVVTGVMIVYVFIRTLMGV